MTLRVGVLLDGNSSGATKAVTSVREAMAALTRTTGETSSALRKADIEAYGKQLDALRARYNPLFATIQRYKAEIAGIRDAHRVGAISSDEMAAALSRERQAALASIAAIKQRNTAIAESPQGGAVSNRFNSSNVAAQFQDIAVTSAMGMNPLQIALQQGTQLSAVFNEMRAAGQGVGATLAAAFTSIINPVSLVTIGVVAATAAALQLGSALLSSGKDATAAFEKHIEWLDRLLEGYGKARDAAKAAITEAKKLPQGAIQSELSADLKRQQEGLKTALEEFRNYSTTLVSSAYAEAYLPADQQQIVAGFADEFARLQTAINDTPASLAAVVTRLTEIKNSDAREEVRQTAQKLLDLANAAQMAAGSVAAATAAVNAFSAPSFRGLGITDQLEAIRSLTPDLRTTREQVNDLFNSAVGEARTTSELQTLTEAVQRFNEEMDKKDAAERAEKDKAQAARIAKQVSEYDRAITSIRERTEAQRIESNVVGLSTFAAERYRVTLELENAARKDAKGLSEDRIRQIREEANAHALAAAQQEAISERQRKADEDLQFYRQTNSSFFAELYRGLRTGVDGWDALREAGANALDSIGQRAMNMVANGIFDLIFGAFTGALGGGGVSLGRAGSFGIGGLPMYANGTNNHPGGLAMINERGRGEIVNLPGGTKVIPHDVSMEMARSAGRAGAPNLVYAPQISGIGMTEKDLQRVLAADRLRLRAEFPAMYHDAVRRAQIG